MRSSTPTTVRNLGIPGLLALLTCAVFGVLPALAQEQSPQRQAPEQRAALIRAARQEKVNQVWEGARVRMKEAREIAREIKRAKRGGRQGLRVRPASSEEGALPGDVPAPPARSAGESNASPLISDVTSVIPTNVRCNNTAGDGAGSGQSEEMIASLGDDVLVGWNDGQGFIGPYRQGQGYGYSTDGGATFTDGIFPPVPGAGMYWLSDPIVTINEKTGEFYFCAIFGDSATGANVTNGLATVRATFSGASLIWDTPHIVESVASATDFYDKEWMVADSLSGKLYLTYTHFDVSDSVIFRVSSDKGVTWGPKITLSSLAAKGRVQGSQPAVGPDGEVYVTWYEIGPIDVDFLRIRKSTNQGASFGAEATAASFFNNFGTGSPGFNRNRGIPNPAIVVDRTTGANRGRVYVAYNECVNFYDDPLGGGGALAETENNNFYSRANTFTPGQQLTGSLTSATSPDYFKFSATQGTTYIFWCNTPPTTLYTMRIFCSDTTSTTWLAYSGDVQAPAGGQGFIVWTAPTTATYYFRMAFVAGAGASSPYGVVTGTNSVPGAEIGRDQRDAIIARSDNGTTWSKSRANDDPGYFDNFLSTVGVGADGEPYTLWFDYREAATCGNSSNIYITRSLDGGATWAANQKITSSSTTWGLVSTNIAPNMGDYNHVYGDARYVRPTWADGRGGTPDVWTCAIDTYYDIASCHPDTSVETGGGAIPIFVPVSITNHHPLYANDYTIRLTSQRGWPLPSAGVVSVGSLATLATGQTLVIPDSALNGVNVICMTVQNAKGSVLQQCCFNLNILHGGAGVGDGAVSFSLRQSAPNPARDRARIDFTLPRDGAVKLTIYGLAGERVRTLVDGQRPAGLNSVLWDGRDEAGRVVRPGAYFYKLEGLGHSAVRRLVIMR